MTVSELWSVTLLIYLIFCYYLYLTFREETKDEIANAVNSLEKDKCMITLYYYGNSSWNQQVL